jgi:cytochrome b561
MNNKATKVLVWIHWLTLILIIMAFSSMEFRSIFGKHTLFHDVMKTSHFYIGITVLTLVIIRLLVKSFATKLPAIEPSIKSKIQKMVSKFVHVFLYLWLITMPLLGWLMLSAFGSTSIPFGLPPLISATTPATAYLIEDIHIYLAWTGLAVIILHASGALFNHYCLKNNVLKRMSL